MLARWLVRVIDAQGVWTKPLGDFVHGIVHGLFHRMPAVRDLLNGRWLGHPLHAVLTDAPIGILFLVIVFDVLAMPVAAAWTLASLAALANGQAASVTYFDAAGPNGLIAADASPRPIHHLFAALAPFFHARVCSATCSHPLSIAALAVETSRRRVLFAAGFGTSPQEVRITGAWGERTLTIGPHLEQIELAPL